MSKERIIVDKNNIPNIIKITNKDIRDLTGMIFGKLKTIGYVGSKSKRSLWLCECQCEDKNLIIVSSRYLSYKSKNKSCGCLDKHGLSGTRLYNIWAGIKGRCYNKYDGSYKYCGAKGINMYDEWENNFINFYNWAINNGYKDNLKINRIDKIKGFYPNNCFWGNDIDLANNTIRNHLITINEEIHTIGEWARIKNIKYATLHNRIKRGVEIEDLFKTRQELINVRLKDKRQKEKENRQQYYNAVNNYEYIKAELNKSGVYKIENLINHKKYVGSSVNIYKRWKEHIQKLRNNKHHSIYLQNAWNKYGEGNFKFEVIQYVEDENELINREQYWIDELGTYKYEYNECQIAGSPLGFKHSDETKLLMSKNSGSKRKIIQLEIYKDKINYNNKWDSIKDAAYTYKIDMSGLSKTCKKINKFDLIGGFSAGYFWMYEENYIDNIINNLTKENINDLYLQLINKRTKNEGNKHVLQIDLEGNIVREFYDNFKNIGKYVNIQGSSINKACKEISENKRHLLYNHIWILKSDYESGKVNIKNLLNKINNKNKHSILQFDINGNIIKEWYDTFKNIGLSIGISGQCIKNCCKRTQFTAKGYMWLFKDDYLKNGIIIKKEKVNNKPFKTILQIDKNDNIINTWNVQSFRELHNLLNIKGGINKCCNGKLKSCAGYKWVEVKL